MTCLLAVKNLTLSRGRARLAQGVGFALEAGQYLEIFGANGSGKTTLLRLLAGVQETRGAGAAIECAPGNRFYFAARDGLRPELTVREQLALSLALHNAHAEPDALLAQVGLTPQADLPVGRLSEGQRRRLLLASMAGSGRRVWLIDEPLNALDADGVQVLGALLATHLAHGGGAVIATHRALDTVLPQLAARGARPLRLQNGRAQRDESATRPTTPPAAQREEWHVERPAALSDLAALRWVLKRELKLLVARPQDALWPAVFHWMVVSLFPFGLGAEPALLAKIAPGIFWVSALLSLLLASQRFFGPDHEHGALTQMQVAGVPLAWLSAGKLIAGLVAVGLPLAASSVPLGLQYGLAASELLLLAGSMAVGLVSVCALCALFAALGLMARQAQVVVSLMAIPAFVPVLIFGTATVASPAAGLSATAPFLVLVALAFFALVAAPFVTARVLALALD